MEAEDEDASAPKRDGVPVHLGQDLDVVAEALDPRRPNEDGTEGLRSDAVDFDVGLKARDLPAEGVAPGRDVQEAEVLAVEDYEPCARPEDRTAGVGMGANGL